MAGGDKIRVLIVDDIAETRENVSKLLQFESDIEVVGTARTGREGIDLANEMKPDVILMDINMPDMDGITATETIRRDVSFSQIVILSVQGDPNYMRRAMLAGARDFLTKPPTVDELTSAVRRAGSISQKEKARGRSTGTTNASVPGQNSLQVSPVSFGQVIVVYSPKGGVGCSTVAANLAVTLQNEETPVALVDGNLQFGDVAVILNEQGKNSISDLAPRADELDPEIIQEVMIQHVKSGISVLAAPYRPEYAENITDEQFSKVIDYLRKIYSYIIIDTATNLEDVTLAAIDASDVVILLTTQDIPTIKNARLFLDLADVLHIDRSRIIFIMNKYDKRIGITPEKIGDSFKHDIVAVLPEDTRVVLPSINRGVPFMLGDKSRPIHRSFLTLTAVVRERLAELKSIPESV
ncbi:MAG: response regulator [Anaerolineales bacterium]|nr:response regulator [Anaerolineales bacterium]